MDGGGACSENWNPSGLFSFTFGLVSMVPLSPWLPTFLPSSLALHLTFFASFVEPRLSLAFAAGRLLLYRSVLTVSTATLFLACIFCEGKDLWGVWPQ